MNTLPSYLATLVPPMEPERQKALALFREQGLPTVRDEAWKYTSLAHLNTAELHAAASAESAMQKIGAYPGHVLAFVNGALVSRYTRVPGATLGSLAEAAKTPTVRKHLGKHAGTATLTLLNNALWRDGAFIHVPAGERLAEAIFLPFIATEADAMLHPRILAVLEAGAQAVLVEHYTSASSAPYWQNTVAEIVLKEGARLTHLKFTEEGAAATHTGRIAVHQERDSSYQSLSVSIGGKLARHDLNVRLHGEGASTRLDGLFVADGRRHVDHHLRVEHLAAHTASRVTYRGMAAGRGRGVFDGLVVVHPGGQHADAALSSRNLLLSPYAEIDTKPQFEIYADEVKCGHGATVGQLDEAQLFYLRSRGMDAAAARSLLLRAFANEALVQLDDSGLSGWLEPLLLPRLPEYQGADHGYRSTCSV